MKPKYYIGELEFKTKKDCETYTRNIINTLGCCEIKKDNAYFIFFNNLIKNHPKYELKKGAGIDYFFIVHNPIAKGYQTMIKNIDNAITIFSWNQCCEFKVRPINHYLVDSLRNAIKDDTIKYKCSRSKLICNLCKTENKLYEEYHVDHDNPSFLILKNDFLQLTTKNIPSLFSECEKYNFTIFKDEDIDFKNEWIEYHNKHCNFQILCCKCNLSKLKK